MLRVLTMMDSMLAQPLSKQQQIVLTKVSRKNRRQTHRTADQLREAALLSLVQGPQSYTRVMYTAELSWSHYDQVFHYLFTEGLMVEQKGPDFRYRRTLAITEKGRRYLESLSKMNELLDWKKGKQKDRRNYKKDSKTNPLYFKNDGEGRGNDNDGSAKMGSARQML